MAVAYGYRMRAEEAMLVAALGGPYRRTWPGRGGLSRSYTNAMYFFVRTQNPRPTFHLDMTAEERATMQRHVAYWSEKALRGVAIV